MSGLPNGLEPSRKRWSVREVHLAQRAVIDTQIRTYLDKFLTKAGPASDEQWVPGEETITSLERSKVLSVSRLAPSFGLLANRDPGSCMKSSPRLCTWPNLIVEELEGWDVRF